MAERSSGERKVWGSTPSYIEKGVLFAGQGGRRHTTSKAKQRAASHFSTSHQMVK